MAVLSEDSEPADPEKTLLECLTLFQDDRKLLALILTWIESYGDLIHIERLCTLAKSRALLELAWLGGVASHASQNDSRWSTVVRFVEKKLANQRRRFETSQLDSIAVKRKEKDSHFAKFGLTIPTVTPAGTKKLRARSATIQTNTWFRLRLLFGTNWRADIAMAMLQAKD